MSDATTPPDDWASLEDDAEWGGAVRPAHPEQAKIDVASGVSLGSGRSREENRNQVAQFKCPHCNGTGRFVRGFYNVRDYGPCNKCKGTGKLKTDPMVQAARNQARRQAKAKRLRADVEAWQAANPAEWAWIQDKANRLRFAASMQEALHKYGSLTDGQLAAVRRLMAQDDERAAERASRPADAQLAGAGFTRMLQAFAAAKASGLKRPKFRTGELTFSLAPLSSTNPGFLYVKQDGLYLGKISPTGAFSRGRDCAPEALERITQACADPLAAAVLHGKQTGRCSCCGAELENEESVRLGIGPICRSKWGL